MSSKYQKDLENVIKINDINKIIIEYANVNIKICCDHDFVIIKDGKLVAHQAPTTNYPLSPTYKDGFSFSDGNIYFTRDKKNRIDYMKIFVGRARNVAFKKITQ